MKLCSIVVVLLCICPLCSSVTRYITHVQNYINLVSAYSMEGYSTVDFPPLSDVNETMNVDVGISLYAINGFDEVAGNIEIVAVLRMGWFDEMSTIHSISFLIQDKDSFMVPYNSIWTPKLILTNAVGDSSEVGDSAYMCRFNMNTNRVTWEPRVVIGGSCTPDVTFYPFDKQACDFIYTAWGFSADELTLTSTSDEFDQSEYGESGEWDIQSTSVETEISNGQSYITFKLAIIRKPLYFAFNILLPVLVLCLLNSTVFLLPAESGERVGFSVTCFLTFVVLLNMIMDIMPRSSNPISFLCYYLVVMMANSGAMTLVTIMLMRVYHKPEKSTVPNWLQKTVTFINCGCARLRCCVLCCRFIRDCCCCRDKRFCGCRKKKVGDSQEQLMEITITTIKDRTDQTESEEESDSISAIMSTIDKKSTRPKSMSTKVKLPKIIVDNENCVTPIKHLKEKRELDDIEGPEVVTDDESEVDSLAGIWEEVTWAEVGRVCDTFFFLVFASGQAFITVVFLVPLFTNDTNSEEN